MNAIIKRFLLFLFPACDKEIPVMEEDIVPERERQPFAAWLHTSSPSFRSGTDTEVSELIETEKRTFDARYSYIGEYFRMKPNPRWERARAVRYDDGVLDVFVLCGNTDAEKIFDNDLVPVIYLLAKRCVIKGGKTL